MILALELPQKNKTISHNLQIPRWTTFGVKRENTGLFSIPLCQRLKPRGKKKE